MNLEEKKIVDNCTDNNSVSPMDIDADTVSKAHKRKRTPSDRDSDQSIKGSNENISQLEMSILNGSHIYNDIKKMLLSKLTPPYRELVDASKFDVDGTFYASSLQGVQKKMCSVCVAAVKELWL